MNQEILNEQKINDEEQPLKVHKLTFWEAAFIIVGANIGSGILGLPYASRLSGWPVLFIWLMLSGFLVCTSMLYVAEVSLRTNRNLQLPGLAQKYVGSLGSWLIFFSVVANSVGCMIAYMAGSGSILSELFGISRHFGSIIFAIPAVIVVWLGLKATGISEKVISLGMLVLMFTIVIASFLSEKADFSNSIFLNWKFAIPVFNVSLFCYIAQYTVPELARGLKHEPKKLAKAISTGMIITFVLLSVIPLAVLTITGPNNISEVATISWGNILGKWAFYTANIFALLAMMTSYWAVAGSMLTNIVDKFSLKSEWDIKTRIIILCIVAIPPFILAYGGFVGFVDAIYLAGTFGGVVMSIVPVLMLRSARKNGDIEPVWKVEKLGSTFMQIILIVVFCSAAIYAIISMFGLLPKGW